MFSIVSTPHRASEAHLHQEASVHLPQTNALNKGLFQMQGVITLLCALAKRSLEAAFLLGVLRVTILITLKSKQEKKMKELHQRAREGLTRVMLMSPSC